MSVLFMLFLFISLTQRLDSIISGIVQMMVLHAVGRIFLLSNVTISDKEVQKINIFEVLFNKCKKTLVLNI